jgi:hypothetical protein
MMVVVNGKGYFCDKKRLKVLKSKKYVFFFFLKIISAIWS